MSIAEWKAVPHDHRNMRHYNGSHHHTKKPVMPEVVNINEELDEFYARNTPVENIYSGNGEVDSFTKELVKLSDQYQGLGLSSTDISFVLEELGPEHARTLLSVLDEHKLLELETSLSGFVDAYQRIVLSKQDKTPFDLEQESCCNPLYEKVMQGIWGYGRVDDSGLNKANPWRSETAIGGLSRQVEDNPAYQQNL
ncbi:MAG: hypothetical protein ISS25_02175 [Nanoarchaeota archaeon]|nr:hypothetical protein [DPANN group archaeon]MBL7116613.1 hypothetical protein [Nanoarchaeota archaeon]